MKSRIEFLNLPGPDTRRLIRKMSTGQIIRCLNTTPDNEIYLQLLDEFKFRCSLFHECRMAFQGN